MSKDGRRNPDDLDRLFRALGHSTRREILRLLARNPRYPYEIAKLLGYSSRVIIKHLESLHEVGLVSKEVTESDLGPDRTYYKLNVSFGLSTTILPNSFVVRITRTGPTGTLTIPQGFSVSQLSPDEKAVRSLLKQLRLVNRKLSELDNERLRFANLRGHIIKRIEEIMEERDWDNESCQYVRSLINPVKSDLKDDKDESPDPLKVVLSVFEDMFKDRKENEEKTKDVSVEKNR